jgi:hypothetical protein
MPINRTIGLPFFRQESDCDSLPTASAEDVEFSDELADEDDREAQERAVEADNRATSCKGE